MHVNITAAAAFAFSVVSAIPQRPPTIDPAWTAPAAPVRIADNVYYVGTVELASYLVTTPQGHILIDTGWEPNAAVVAGNIATLGFTLPDVRIILTTQAHFDHVGAHAKLKAESGARVLVSAADAPVVEGGGKGDYHFGPAYRFPPVKVDGIVGDGEKVTLGGVTLTAHLTPGHTKGDTTWTMNAKGDDGKVLHVVFAGSTSVNPGVTLVANAAYPTIAEDYQHSFAVLKALPCDVFLAAHASQFNGAGKMAGARAGVKPNPFIDPAGYKAYIANREAAFRKNLATQQAGGKL